MSEKTVTDVKVGNPKLSKSDYQKFVRERAPLADAEGAYWKSAASQLIVTPMPVGDEVTLLYAIPEELGGGVRLYATEILEASEQPIPESSLPSLWGAAVDVLSADLEEAYQDAGSALQCGFCGKPRLNGRVLERDPGGGWKVNQGSVNPVRADMKLACRSCAIEKLRCN